MPPLDRLPRRRLILHLLQHPEIALDLRQRLGLGGARGGVFVPNAISAFQRCALRGRRGRLGGEFVLEDPGEPVDGGVEDVLVGGLHAAGDAVEVVAQEEGPVGFAVEGELLALRDAVAADFQGGDWGFDRFCDGFWGRRGWHVGFDRFLGRRGWHIGFEHSLGRHGWHMGFNRFLG